MRQLRFAAFALGLATIALMAAPALAAHNVPTQAKQIKVDLVRAYTACPPGPGVPPGNMHALPLALPGCNPPAAQSPLTLAGAAKGWIKLKVIGGPDVKIQSRIKEVGDPTGVFGPATPNQYNGFLVGQAVLRISDHQGSLPAPGSDITVMDVPFPAMVGCANGNCGANTTANATLPGVVIGGATANIEVQTVDVLDPGGGRFMTQGLFVQ